MVTDALIKSLPLPAFIGQHCVMTLQPHQITFQKTIASRLHFRAAMREEKSGQNVRQVPKCVKHPSEILKNIYKDQHLAHAIHKVCSILGNG